MDSIEQRLRAGALDETLALLYGRDKTDGQRARYGAVLDEFRRTFGERDGCALFSAPGRSEIGGNHTDHQLGRVLAAAVTLDMIAAVAPRGDDTVCIRSEGYEPLRLSLGRLEPDERERGTSAALVRGIAAWLRRAGHTVGGFDAVIASGVPAGSGLSSSAAFGVLIGTILSGLCNGGAVPPAELALASKHAENRYFGKPSGLMDQLACAVGGMAAIDFIDPERPKIERVECDLRLLGYEIAVVNAGGSHAGLTAEYATIPAEMGAVARLFGKTVLREVDEREFYDSLGALRGKVPDRALLRAMHFFAENERVGRLVAAFRARDGAAVLKLINESGRSSALLLQNVCPADERERSVSLALALSERLLGGDGAWRVHGGGFAGTIQAFVPIERFGEYEREMERVFGTGCCYRLSVRPAGGVQIGG